MFIYFGVVYCIKCTNISGITSYMTCPYSKPFSQPTSLFPPFPPAHVWRLLYLKMRFFFKLLDALCLSVLEGNAPPLKVSAQVSGKSGKRMGPHQGHFTIFASKILPLCLSICLSRAASLSVFFGLHYLSLFSCIVLFYDFQLSHFPSCFGAGVTNLNEPPSSFLLPLHSFGLGSGSIALRDIVNNKQCDMRGLSISLDIH